MTQQVKNVPLLSDEAVRSLIDIPSAIEAIENAYADYGRVRQVLSSPPALLLKERAEGQAGFKVKGARLDSLGTAGFRMIADRFQNGQEATIDLCWVADSETGELVGLVDETWLHRLRTALTGVVAAKHLARKPVKIVTIIGAGKIADELPAPLLQLFKPSEMRVVARTRESVFSFAERHKRVAEIMPFTDSSRGAEGADLVISISSAEQPVLKSGYLAPGATVCGMGGGAEIDADVLERCDSFIVDDLEYALTIGSIRGWVEAGISKRLLLEHLDADLGEVVLGRKVGRRNDDAVVLAIVQGMACCDLALARLALLRAGILSSDDE